MSFSHNNNAAHSEAMPLSVDDVRYVAANPKILRDRQQAGEFLARAESTAKLVTNLKLNFEEEVARRAKKGPQGTPSNLSPIEAARYLTREQMNQVFDGMLRQQMAVMDQKEENLNSNLRQVNAVMRTLKQSIDSFMTDETVDATTKQKLAVLLDQAVASAQNLRKGETR